MMKRINKQYGYLSILVNNAGTTHFIKHQELKNLLRFYLIRFTKYIYEVHLFVFKQALPMMKKQEMQILLILLQLQQLRQLVAILHTVL